MLEVNEYFNGKVKSLTFNRGHKATVGVMKPGDYEFSTGLREIMTVVAGQMEVKLPGQSAWKTFAAGEKFEVAAQSKFQLKISHDTAYLCEFMAT